MPDCSNTRLIKAMHDKMNVSKDTINEYEHFQRIFPKLEVKKKKKDTEVGSERKNIQKTKRKSLKYSNPLPSKRLSANERGCD